MFSGLYLGNVEGVRKDGRLEVSVPAVFDKTEPGAHALARPCFPYGQFFVPPVDTKVWIAFENGDPSAPVWLGTWYPQGDTPSEADADPPVKRVLQTSSGQFVVIDDTDGDEKIIVADKTGNRIEMSKDAVLIKCKKKLTIDASGQEVEIKATKVKITEA